MSIDKQQLFKANALDALRDLHKQFDVLDREVGKMVAVSRESSATWQQIGDALGISRQAAWERFASRLGPERTGFPTD